MWEGRGELGTGSFQWLLTNPCEDPVPANLEDWSGWRLSPQILALRHTFITGYLIGPNADYTGKLQTGEDLALTLE